MGGRTGLKDVAAAAGVSVSTASLALSGDRRVAPATAARVAAAAGRLGYVRDPLLASIAAGRFRHAGKPVCVAISTDHQHWVSQLRQQAEAMGMSVRGFDGPLDRVIAEAAAISAAALVLNRRGVDASIVQASAIPVVLWEDEGPADPPVDLVETCEWWTATAGAIARVRAAGWTRPAAVLVPAKPRHWHDDIRLASARAQGIPVLEHDGRPDPLAAFLDAHAPDALVIGTPAIDEALRALRRPLPVASLILNDEQWFARFAGWIPDQQHRGQMTLELIEQRLRYGPRHPRRIVIPPRWRDGQSLRPA